MLPPTPTDPPGSRARRLPLIVVLGFGSGLPLYLTAQTLTAWMAVAGVDLATIGAFALVGLPYTFKWAWSPLFDRFQLPWLGRRRGWMLVLQLAVAAAIAAMGLLDPARTPALLASAAAVTAFLSASQDVVVDAYVAERLAPDERPAGSTAYVLGYRLGILVGGSAALLLAAVAGWRAVYAACAAAMLLAACATLFADEPAPPPAERTPRSLAQTVLRALSLLLRAPRGWAVLGFVALFRFGDHLAQTLLVPFFVRRVGFSLSAVATLSQTLGLVALAGGGAVAGVLVPRLGVRRGLLLFGALQAATNLGYVALTWVGPSLPLLAGVVLADNLANAMGIAAFLSFLMSRCDRSVTATQYALLTSLSSVGARVFGVTGGALVDHLGWSGFFVITALAVVPALALLSLIPVDDQPSKQS